MRGGPAPPRPREPTRQVARLLGEGLKYHRAGAYAQAKRAYGRVLALDPRQSDALHLAGLIAHAEGDGRVASELIERAIAVDPGQAAYHNSRGVVCLTAGSTGESAGEAERHFRAALALDPSYAEAHNNLGNARQSLGRLTEAVACYRAALSFRPDYAEAEANLGRVLHLMGEPAAAVGSFQRALALRPDYAKAKRYLGDSLAELGRRDEAREAYQQALAASRGDADCLSALAALEERSGRLDEALSFARQALAADPGQVRAALAAARACRRQLRIAEGLTFLAPFAAGIPSGTAPGTARQSPELREASALVGFERAMLLDRGGDYAAAYAAFAEANQRMEETWPMTPAERGFFSDLITRLAHRFTRAWVNSWTPPAPAAAGDPPDPIFLIGFPRSGTTLLDQILNAHPALQTMEEKDAVDVIRRQVQDLPGGYPDALAGLTPDALSGLRRRYWEEVGHHLGGLPSLLLVDKMPLNTIDVGLIQRLFPRARFLLTLRHPADVVLSNFMQAFKPNAAMANFTTINGAARFYAEVMGLWQQYARVLPLAVHSIRYENLIADVAGETRRILQFLQLPWDESILGYRRLAKERAITTPSYHQVVEPIYRRAVGRWHHYQPFLSEATAVLAPFLTAFGYDRETMAPDIVSAAGKTGEKPG